MTSQSLPSNSEEQWNNCNEDAAKLDKTIQETSTAYAEAVKKMTEKKVGTLQEGLRTYKF